MALASAVANIMTSSALALAGAAALAMAMRARTSPQPLPMAIAACASIALIALAVDEGLEVHDRAGRWLYREHGVVAPGPVNHVDDIFVLAYLAAGGAAFTMLLPRLLRYPRFVAGLSVAGVLLAGGTAYDALGTHGTWTDGAEESLEAAGAAVMAATIGLHALPGVRVCRHAASASAGTGERRASSGATDTAPADAGAITS